MREDLAISAHAVRRYIERVDRSAGHAGIRLIVADGCVATVLSRAACRSWRRTEPYGHD